MNYEIVLADGPKTETGTLTVRLDREIEIRISAGEARRRVNNWGHMELSSQMHAMPPQLMLTESGAAYWRVPLHLTFPALGDVGRVGAVLVDVEKGEIASGPDLIEDIKRNAQALAKRFTSVPA